MEVIVAIFRNEHEYKAIKGDGEAGRLPWVDHCDLLLDAVEEYRERGCSCSLETCDLAGYLAFLDRHKAKNCPQNTAAYVNAKYRNALKMDYSQLREINIEIIKD